MRPTESYLPQVSCEEDLVRESSGGANGSIGRSLAKTRGYVKI